MNQLFIIFTVVLFNSEQILLIRASNCTYNFEFQNQNDNAMCNRYAETKSQGLKLHIKLLEERLGKLLSKQNSEDTSKCKHTKNYTISYPGEIHDYVA